MTARGRAVLKTLLVSDLVGSTRLVEELGDQAGAELGHRHDRLARDLLPAHEGREIDKTDGFLILFERPLDAVCYALEYHAALRRLSDEEGRRIEARVGINLGEVLLHENSPDDVARGAKPLEVDGLAKPTTGRLMSLARGGQTLLTRGAFDVARRGAVGVLDEEEVSWLAHGGYLVKGVAESVEVFEVGREGAAPLQAPEDSEKVRRVAEQTTVPGWRPIAVAASVVTGILVLAGIAFLPPSSPPPDPQPVDLVPPLRLVAVLKSDLSAGTTSEETDVLAYSVRDVLVRALSSFEGLAPASMTEVDAVSGPPTVVARALGADEILESTLSCRALDCRLELRRVHGTDGRIAGTYRFDVPLAPLLTAAQTVEIGVRQIYPQEELRPGVSEIRATPEDFTTYVEIRRALDKRPGTDETIILGEQLAALQERSPRFVEAAVLEAHIAIISYRDTKEPELLNRALARIARAQTLAPENPQVLLERAYIEIEGNRLGDAERTLDALQRLAPGEVGILDKRAKLHEKRGEKDEALAAARIALDRRPSWERLYRHAWLAKRLGEVGMSRQSLQKLLDQNPEHVFGLSLLANLELINGDPRKAVGLYDRLILHAPTPPRYSSLGLAHMLLGDFGASATACEHAVDAAPDHTLYLLNLADAKWLEGHLEEARDLYRRIVNLKPGDPSARDLTRHAQALAHLGQESEASAAVLEALRKAPEDSNVAFVAALVFTLAGDSAEALAHAERAIGMGYDLRWFNLPWFDELRGHPGFARVATPSP